MKKLKTKNFCISQDSEFFDFQSRDSDFLRSRDFENLLGAFANDVMRFYNFLTTPPPASC